MTLIRRGCLICGAAHATCGGPTTTQPVDVLAVQEPTVSQVQRYRNEKGHVFSMTPEDAAKMGGMTLVKKAARPAADKAVKRAPADKGQKAESE